MYTGCTNDADTNELIQGQDKWDRLGCHDGFNSITYIPILDHQVGGESNHAHGPLAPKVENPGDMLNLDDWVVRWLGYRQPGCYSIHFHLKDENYLNEVKVGTDASCSITEQSVMLPFNLDNGIFGGIPGFNALATCNTPGDLVGAYGPSENRNGYNSFGQALGSNGDGLSRSKSDSRRFFEIYDKGDGRGSTRPIDRDACKKLGARSLTEYDRWEMNSWGQFDHDEFVPQLDSDFSFHRATQPNINSVNQVNPDVDGDDGEYRETHVVHWSSSETKVRSDGLHMHRL